MPSCPRCSRGCTSVLTCINPDCKQACCLGCALVNNYTIVDEPFALPLCPACRVVAASNSDDPTETYRRLALYFLEAGAKDARALEHARPYLVALRQSGIDSGWLYFLLGRFWSQQNELDEAEAAYGAVVGSHPGHAVTWSNLATVLRRKGNLEGAAQCATRAVQLEPEHGPAYANLANILMQGDHLDEALAAASVAWGRFRIPVGLDIMGRIHLAREQYQEAEACFSEFLSFVPTGAVADQARSFLSAARSGGANLPG